MANKNKKNSFGKALRFVKLDHIPGPRGLKYYNYVKHFQRDILGAFTQTYLDYGHIASFPWPMNSIIIYGPELIKEVLQTSSRDYEKGEQIEELKAVVGNGLATNNDMESWKKSRSIISKEFGPRAVKGFFDTFSKCVTDMCDELKSMDETKIDFCNLMKVLTFKIACESFLGKGLSPEDARKVHDGVEFTSVVTYERIFKFFPLPYWVPTPTHIQFNKHFSNLKSVVDRLIEEESNNQAHDQKSILERLVHAKDENGNSLSKSELRDEILTLLLAGHETSAHTLTWALGLIATHPQIQDKIYEEIKEVNAPPSMETIDSLPTLKNALFETMRLYPAFPVLSRKVKKDTVLNGMKLDNQTNVVIPIYVMQRSSEFFDDPLKFDPSRFENDDILKNYKYLPFSKGTRKCVGEYFAMIEMTCILFYILKNFKISSNTLPKDEAYVSLRPVGGMWLDFKKR